MKELILGGIRSGKSRLAEQRARETGHPVTYIATAVAADEEMRARIAAHRMRRPDSWTVIEEPRALAAVLSAHAAPGRCLVVECLTLWLTNLLLDENPNVLAAQRSALLAHLPELPGHVIFVANETGMGVIPAVALARRFCDEAGQLHQEIAAHCDRVILCVSGLPCLLKGKQL